MITGDSFGLSTTRSRLCGIVGTLLFHGLVLAIMLLMVMGFNRRRDEMLEMLAAEQAEMTEQEDDIELLLAGEYVTIGDDFLAEAYAPEETAPPSAAADAKNASESMVVTTAPAPIKSTPPRDTKADDERRRRALEEQRAQEVRDAQAKQIGERVQFGKPGEGEPSMLKPGSADGNTDAPGHPPGGKPGANLKGRTLANWDTPRAARGGTIVISVRVDRKGRVVAASYASGTGPVSSDAAARNACIAAAKRSSFSVADDAPAEQIGTITYKFTAPSAK